MHENASDEECIAGAFLISEKSGQFNQKSLKIQGDQQTIVLKNSLCRDIMFLIVLYYRKFGGSHYGSSLRQAFPHDDRPQADNITADEDVRFQRKYHYQAQKE